MSSSIYSSSVLYDGVEVDVKTSGSTLILSTDSSTGNFNVMNIGAIVSMLNTIITGGFVSIGTNSPNYDNILPSTAIVNALSSGTNLPLFSSQPSKVVQAGSDIYMKVNSVAIATSFKIRPWIEGFFA